MRGSSDIASIAFSSPRTRKPRSECAQTDTTVRPYDFARLFARGATASIGVRSLSTTMNSP
jgi:hypothetical protein